MRAAGTGGFPGDIGGNWDWEVEMGCQLVRPNLASAQVHLHIQDLLSLDLDLVLGVAKIFLAIEGFLMLQ
jgi:hypothetical protein